MVLLLYLWENVRKFTSYDSFDSFDQLEKGGGDIGGAECLDVVISSSGVGSGESCRDSNDPNAIDGLGISGMDKIINISIIPDPNENTAYQQVCAYMR